MIKLQDFARECGVTDRAIQKHLKTYAAELEGLYKRKGPNGTWLSDEACEILRSKMRTTQVMIFDASLNERLQELEKENKELLKEVNAARKEAVEAQKQLLEAKGAQARLEGTQALLEASESRAEALQAEIDRYEPFAFGLWRKRR